MIHSRKQEILLEISSLHCETHTVISSYSQLYCLECNELHIDAALKGNVNSAKSTILTLYSIFQELETTGMTTLSKGEIRKLYMSVSTVYSSSSPPDARIINIYVHYLLSTV